MNPVRQSRVTSESWSDWLPYFDEEGEFYAGMASLRDILQAGLNECKASHSAGLATLLGLEHIENHAAVKQVRAKIRAALNEFKDGSRSGGTTYLALTDLFRLEGDARNLSSLTDARWHAYLRLGRLDRDFLREITDATFESVEAMSPKQKAQVLESAGLFDEAQRKNILAGFRRIPNARQPRAGWEIEQLRVIVDLLATNRQSETAAHSPPNESVASNVPAVLVNSQPDGDIAIARPDSFHESVVELLRVDFRCGNFSDVIRIGDALSRPFFETGAFSVRLEVGRMVEEAAARSSRRREQYVALIDPIGWSLIELGEYESAAREIRHGLQLLEDVDDPFYEAKAHRHLGVIARREGDFGEARRQYERARDRADDIVEARDGLVMTAGLQYALASLAFHEGDVETAERNIVCAIDSFVSLGDEYRLNMALVLRGDIEFRRNAPYEALDTYRLVLQNADRNHETLQYVRACLGLADVRASDNKWDDVREVLSRLDGLDLDQYKAELARLSTLNSRMPVE